MTDILAASMSEEAGFVPRTGEVSAFFHTRDWAQTSLGPMSGWPGSLRTVLRLMLGSRYAMWMGYGKDLTFFYNDAYAQDTLAAKHPWALGRPTAEVWSEIWDEIEPRIAHVLRTGEATYDEGLLLFLERNGYEEETYHSFSYSPVPGENPDEVAGLFCVVVEETDRVINERRLSILRDLAALLGPVTDPAHVFPAVVTCLRSTSKDFPFSQAFLLEEVGPRSIGTTGFDVAPEAPVWPLDELVASRSTVTFPLPTSQPWPAGPWTTPPTQALVLPVPDQGGDGLVGAIVLGLNPHRALDEGMTGFIDLFVGQIAASFATATAHRAQQERAEALAELDRAKTAFFSNVSHEFRTPLTLMLGPTQDALASPDRALRGAELETVHRNELRLLKLVNALLDFARLEAGRTQASYEPTDLAALTTDLASLFRSAIDRGGLAFDVECEPLPEEIFVDHEMWEKIVLNLLSNALKFTFEGRIGVTLRWREDHAELAVSDTGVGVSAIEVPRLFERFHRVEGTRARTHEGSGIGLALVHDLVALHGGTITATSELGRGTTFTITLPVGKAHLPAHQIGADPRSSSTGGAGGSFVEEALRWLPDSSPGSREGVAPSSREGTPRILVADDNQDMREYIARILRQHFNVDLVADGAAAMEAMRDRSPDLVLSDVMMPGVDGFELVRRMRSEPATAAVPIILLSARAGEEATADGLRSGADDYLVKPFSAGSLLVRVEAQLSAAKLRRTLAETAEAERRRLQSIFEESPAAIAFLRGDDLFIELANPTCLTFWGVTASAIGHPLLDAVPALRGQGFETLLHEVQASGVTYRAYEHLARLDREGSGQLADHYYDFVYAPLRGDPFGQDRAVVVTAFDVTDKVLARRNVEQLREVAEAANRVKDEFLATMSHELRTPLNAILGWATMMRERPPGDWAKIDRGLATIERNARAQARLIEDVLDVSRIISGKLRLEMAPTDLVAVVNAALDVVRPAAAAKGVRLVSSTPDDGGVEILADADRLQQVAWNLLSNAVKFTRAGDRVELHLVQRNDGVELVVSDTGAGISPEHLPFVFERFRQADSSSTRKYGGLGLGLAIVRHLVELHGGSAAAASEGEGHGATFRVWLPLRTVGPSSVTMEVPVHEHATSSKRAVDGQLRGVRVLVVDDNEDSRLVIEGALALAGAAVTTAGSALEAIASLEREPVDVLISDIGMPNVDGYAFLERVRAQPGAAAQLPAIALTAYASANDVARAERAGFQRHMAKPADIGAIVRMVASLAPRTAR